MDQQTKGPNVSRKWVPYVCVSWHSRDTSASVLGRLPLFQELDVAVELRTTIQERAIEMNSSPVLVVPVAGQTQVRDLCCHFISGTAEDEHVLDLQVAVGNPKMVKLLDTHGDVEAQVLPYL
jgi:hypothetical protein